MSFGEKFGLCIMSGFMLGLIGGGVVTSMLPDHLKYKYCNPFFIAIIGYAGGIVGILVSVFIT